MSYVQNNTNTNTNLSASITSQTEIKSMEPSTQTIQVTDCCKNMPDRNVHNLTNVQIASVVSTSPISEIRNTNGKRFRNEVGCTLAVQRANKIRAIQKPLDALAAVLTKHVAKVSSSVFSAQSSVQSSVNLHSGGIM